MVIIGTLGLHFQFVIHSTKHREITTANCTWELIALV
jgi:hypothetical protein